MCSEYALEEASLRSKTLHLFIGREPSDSRINAVHGSSRSELLSCELFDTLQFNASVLLWAHSERVPE